MTEHIAQMGPMLILGAFVTAWMAEALSRAGGYGLMIDMVVGLVGSVVGGTMVWFLVYADAGMPGMFLIGCAGAALAIGAQRGVWRSLRLVRRTDRWSSTTLASRAEVFASRVPASRGVGIARCQGCGAELQFATQRFCGGDRCLQVLVRSPELQGPLTTRAAPWSST